MDIEERAQLGPPAWRRPCVRRREDLGATRPRIIARGEGAVVAGPLDEGVHAERHVVLVELIRGRSAQHPRSQSISELLIDHAFASRERGLEGWIGTLPEYLVGFLAVKVIGAIDNEGVGRVAREPAFELVQPREEVAHCSSTPTAVYAGRQRCHGPRG